MNTGLKSVTHRAKRDKTAVKEGGVMGDKEQKITWKQLTIRIPADVHHALKIRVAEEDRSIAVTVEGLIRQYLVGGKQG